MLPIRKKIGLELKETKNVYLLKNLVIYFYFFYKQNFRAGQCHFIVLRVLFSKKEFEVE